MPSEQITLTDTPASICRQQEDLFEYYLEYLRQAASQKDFPLWRTAFEIVKGLSLTATLYVYKLVPYKVALDEYCWEAISDPVFSVDLVGVENIHHATSYLERYLGRSRAGAQLTEDEVNRYLKEEGHQASECDWRPKETLPEDYYIL